MSTSKTFWQWLVCCFFLIKSRSIFRPALIIIDQDRYGWDAGVNYDASRKLYIGYIIAYSSYRVSSKQAVLLQKMKWYREWDDKYRSSAWKNILG